MVIKSFFKRYNIITSIRITSAYIIIGILWIFFSDIIVNAIFPDPSQIQTIKGFFYVFVTGFLLFLLIEKSHRILEKTLMDKKEFEQKFLQAQKMQIIGHFMGKISHDVRNQLMLILGNIELIEEDESSNEKITEIKQSVKDTQEILNQLLNFSRKDSSTVKSIYINEIISTQVNLMTPLLKDTNIKVILDLEANIFPIDAQRTHIVQIITNIVLNSRDAIVEKLNRSSVSIKSPIISIQTQNFGKDQKNLTEFPTPFIKMTIFDEGIGMKPNDLSHMFKHFYTTKSEKGGTGLGMVAIKSLVDQLKGKIRIESEYGTGTTISIFFPLSKSYQE